MWNLKDTNEQQIGTDSSIQSTSWWLPNGRDVGGWVSEIDEED